MTERAEGKAPEARRPYHVGVYLGLSAGVYAVSLAGVTALQSWSEQATTAAQAPTVAAIDALGTGHDALGRRLAGSSSAYQDAAAGYQRAADKLGTFEQQLGALSTSVADVTGAASSQPTGARLPSQVSLPALPKLPTISLTVPAAPPVVHATTGASGKPVP